MINLNNILLFLKICDIEIIVLELVTNKVMKLMISIGVFKLNIHMHTRST